MFDQPFVSLVDIIAAHGKFRGDRPALICAGRTLSWRALDASINQAAAAFQAAGLTRGDRIALLGSTGIDAIVMLFAIVRAGGVATPLSGLLDATSLATLLDDSGARFFVAATPFDHLARAAIAIATRLPADGAIALDFEDHGWRKLPTGDTPAPILFSSTDPMNIIYSSGTTGVPKGIVHSHLARVNSALGLGLEFRIHSASTAILATPIYTNGTWMTMLPTIAVGGTCHIMADYSAEGFLDAVETGGSHAFLVPTQIRGILDALEARPRDLSALRMIVSAGSPIPQPWKQEAIGKLGGRLMELYGLTEGIATTLKPEDIARKPLSVGTPISGVDMLILDGEDQPAPPGAIGEIAGYGSGMMSCYHNRPEATEDAIWRDRDGRTYLRTGDIGRFDEDGFLYVLDRKKDMIVSGGVNVFAIDIEQVLHQHDAVLQAAVVAAPHPKWVETPVAFVICKPGADANAIRVWANARLAKHQQIDRVVLRTDDFPRNALGKVLKRRLREDLLS